METGGRAVILTIAREQLRRQRGYVASLIVIVAAAVGFATFATTMATTQGAVNHASDVAIGNAAPFYATAVFTDDGLPEPKPLEDWGDPMTLATFERLLDQANAQGAHVRGDASAYASISRPEAVTGLQPIVGWWGNVTAVWGEAPWDQLLEEGEAPGRGEIVLSGEVAKSVGVSLGDSVVMSDTGHGEDAVTQRSEPLRVSGIVYDYSSADWARDGMAFLSAGDVDILEGIVITQSTVNDLWPLQGAISWEEPSPVLESELGFVGNRDYAARLFGSSSPIAWVVAVALTLGTVIVAIALGRAQAGDRARWTATARALGARRSHLLAAACVEWAVIATASGVAGIGGGVAAAALAHQARLGALAAPPPIPLAFPVIVPALMAALAAILAAVIVVFPAVAAVRVPPTAALKETASQDELELSRRVPLWPVAVLSALMFIALLFAQSAQTDESYWASLFLIPAVAVSGIAVAVDGARRAVVALGRRLSHSARPWTLHAGMTLTAHPRQAAAITLLHALTLTATVGWHMADAIAQQFSWIAWAPRGSFAALTALWDFTGHHTYVIAAFATANALAVVLMGSALRVTDKEGATARALGLTGRDAAISNAVAWSLVSATGNVMGWVLGVFVVGAVALAVNSTSMPDLASGDLFRGFFTGAWTSLAVVVLAAVAAAATSTMAAVALRRRVSTGQTVG